MPAALAHVITRSSTRAVRALHASSEQLSGHPVVQLVARFKIAAAAVLAVVASVIAMTVSLAAAGASTTVIMSDDMSRSVASGFGSAQVGGAYTVSSPSQTNVTPGAGHFVNIAPGKSVSARLNATQAKDLTAQLTFLVPAQPTEGNGLYLYLEMRRQANGDDYTAKVRIQPTGVISLSFSRYQSGVEVPLGTERPVLTARPGQQLTVAAQVSGASPTTLNSSVWAGAASSPHSTSWMNSVVDNSTAQVSGAGSLGINTYYSGSAHSATALTIQAWQATSVASPAPGGSNSGSPTSSASTSAAPTSSAPTSSAPTSAAPTSSTSSSSTPTAPPSLGAGSTSSAGSATPGTTAYPIPAGAVFVSPSGNDTSAGTQAAPFRTLARAVAAAPAGSTIVMRAGTYNESVTVQANKPLTIQSYPHEAVWLDGSIPVNSWTQTGNVWVHSGWTPQFNSIAGYTGTASTGAYNTFVNPAYPMAANPDQMWSDGTALTQVGSSAAVGPGDFFVDYANQQLVVGSDPTAHQLTASNLNVALTSYAPNFVVRGIGVRNYATAIGDIGAVRLAGSGDVAENVESDNNATTGLSVTSTNVTVRNVTVQGNGMLGMLANRANNLTVSGLRAQNNNTQHFNYAPVSGGLKITFTRGISVSGSAFVNNLGTGLWFDCSSYGMTVTGNTVSGNSANGISDEISSTGVIANNVVQNNGAIGLKINDTDHLQVWNNTITGNGSDVQLVQDARRGNDPSVYGHDLTRPQPDPTEPWIVSDNTVINNIIGSAAATSPELIVRDYSGQYSAADLREQIANNVFIGPGSASVVQWATTPTTVATYATVAAFQAATGQLGNVAATTLSQAAAVVGQPLTSALASVTGRPTGGAVVGAA